MVNAIEQSGRRQLGLRRVFCLTAVCGVCLSFPAAAQYRESTGKQREWVARQADRWLAHPSLYLQEILGPLLRIEGRPYAEIETGIRKKLTEKGATPEQLAAYHLVLAKTAYWRGASEFRNTHDPSVFRGLAEKVWPEMLAALPRTLSLPVDNPVRALAVREARSLLAGALFGKRLAPDLKKKIVKEFIDPISKESDGPATWSLTQKARVFRNLDIGDRLKFHLPDPLPENDGPELRKLARKALVLDPKAALPVAEALEKETAKTHSPEAVFLIAEIWRRNGRTDKARAYFKDCETEFPWCLPVYYSFLGKVPNPPPRKTRVRLLLNCLDWFDAEHRKKPEQRRKAPASRASMYDRIQALLFHDRSWKETLEVIERGEKNHVRSYETDQDRYMRALCLDHLGRKREALRYYKLSACIGEPMRGRIRARIEALEKAIQAENSRTAKGKENNHEPRKKVFP